MAAHLPVLTTPVGDSARIVKDGKAGYVLEPDNAQEMAERIVSLVRDPTLANQMGETGRKLVERDYNLASLAPRLISTFCDFATKHGRKSIPRLLGEKPPVNTYTTSRVSTNGLSASTA
jgi:glycosyltransferase involved in cell wall biosynthesis